MKKPGAVACAGLSFISQASLYQMRTRCSGGR
jgi:hypothetical protein